MAAPPGERLWPLVIYGVQLVFNAGWSALFFGAKRMDLAFVDALLMLTAIAATMVAFYTHSPEAALLLAPYLLWVGFAAALNYNIMRRNMPRQRAT
jgi:tryptophan-rich sensory protein